MSAHLRADLGCGPAIGPFADTSILSQGWQAAVLAAAAIGLLIARRGIVQTLLAAGSVGAILALAGAPVPR